jgi:putative Holliday junction resolvase
VKAGRILAIDHGGKRSGTALSDRSRVFAFPAEVYEGEKELLAAVSRLAAEGDLAAVVVGLPLNMDGSCGERAREVLDFCDRLRAEILEVGAGVEVVTWDERLTSFEAENLLRESGVRQSRREELVDAVAAQRILESFLRLARTEDSL